MNALITLTVDMVDVNPDLGDDGETVLDCTFPLPPLELVDVDYNPDTGEIVKEGAGFSSHGCMQLTIPGSHGIKPGDKIAIVKL